MAKGRIGRWLCPDKFPPGEADAKLEGGPAAFLPSFACGANMPLMDVLGKLESRIEQLLAHLSSLKEENSRFKEELATLQRENIDLTRENGVLRESIAKQDALRLEALRRLRKVLGSIKDYGTGAHSSGS